MTTSEICPASTLQFSIRKSQRDKDLTATLALMQDFHCGGEASQLKLLMKSFLGHCGAASLRMMG